MKAKINLDTMRKINAFVSICAGLDCKVDLVDGSGYRVSAKSLIGAMATTDWTEVFVISENDIYWHIKDFVED